MTIGQLRIIIDTSCAIFFIPFNIINMKNLFSGLFLLYMHTGIAQSITLLRQKLDTVHVKVSFLNYKGRQAARILGTDYTKEEMAILKNTNFTTGTIEADVSGDRLPGTDVNFRGFIGIAFRNDYNPY